MPENVLIETHIGLPGSNEELPLPSGVDVEEYSDHKSRPMCRIGTDAITEGVHVIIVDDLLTGQKKNSFLTSLFSIFSHHHRICVFLITQQIFNNTDLNRSLARNTENIIICKSAVASGTLRALQNQYFAGQQQYLSSAYHKILAQGGRYIYIDLSSACNDGRRVKCGLLKEEVE